MIASLTLLTEHHRRELANSGISDETIAAAGVFSQSSIRKKDKSLQQQLVFPYLDPAGRPYQRQDERPFIRWKPVWSEAVQRTYAAQLKEPPKYLSHRGAGNRPYHSPANTADPTYRIKLKRGGSKFPLLATEGEKKTLKANQENFLTIGLVGVYGWTDSRCEPDQDGDKTLLPELLSEIEFSNRIIYIAFDSDLDKPEVRNAINGFVIACHKLGATCRLIRFPVELDRSKNGLDDFLQRHGPDALQLLMDNAQELQVVRQPALKESKGPPTTYIYSVKHWGAEPKGKPASHLKAVSSYAVLKENWAHRQSAGLYRWVGTHWQRQKERAEKAIRIPLQEFNDSQRWVERESNQTNSVIGLLLDRLTKGDDCEWSPGHLLSFKNGTLDTKTGRLSVGHRRTDLITTALPFDYDPEATCPTWLEFLDSAFAKDQGLIDLMQAIVKWIVLPKDRSVPFKIQKAFNFHGLRGSGKGTAAETIAALIGEEFVGGGKPEVFGKEEALSKLVDKKLALDMDADGFLPSSSTFNKVVSNERVDFRYLFRDGGYERLGVVILWCSNDPIIISKNGAEGVGRRLVTVPFNHPPAIPDMNLGEKLRDELAGIFQWAWRLLDEEMYARLSGALDHDQVREATVNHQLVSNHPLEWWLETFNDGGTAEKFPNDASKEGWIGVPALMRSYSAWLQECHYKDQGRDSLTSLLTKLASQGAVEKKKSNGRMFYRFGATAEFDIQGYLGMNSLPKTAPTSPGSPIASLDSDRSDDDASSLKSPSHAGFSSRPSSPSSPSSCQGGQGVKTSIIESEKGGLPPEGDAPPFSEKDVRCASLGSLAPQQAPQAAAAADPALGLPVVDEPLMAGLANFRDWVSAAIDGLGYQGITATPDLVYAVIRGWSRAPTISHSEVSEVFNRLQPAATASSTAPPHAAPAGCRGSAIGEGDRLPIPAVPCTGSQRYALVPEDVQAVPLLQGKSIEVQNTKTGKWEPGWRQIVTRSGSATFLCSDPQGHSRQIHKRQIRDHRDTA